MPSIPLAASITKSKQLQVGYLGHGDNPHKANHEKTVFFCLQAKLFGNQQLSSRARIVSALGDAVFGTT